MAGIANRRKKLLIDHSQRQLLGVYFVHFMVVLVVFFAALLFKFNQQVIRSSMTVDEKQEFASLMTSFANRMWPAMWVLFLFMVLHAIYVSHKIAGPLYRIRTVLTYIGTGNLTARAKLRRGDYLTQDAETLNQMVGELDRRVGQMREDCVAANRGLEALQGAIEGGSRNEAKRHLTELKSRIENWKQVIDQFETTSRKPTSERTPATAAPAANARVQKAAEVPSRPV
jgi:nitrate/nitrite-specific signal transduction histidine kinase